MIFAIALQKVVSTRCYLAKLAQLALASLSSSLVSLSNELINPHFPNSTKRIVYYGRSRVVGLFICGSFSFCLPSEWDILGLWEPWTVEMLSLAPPSWFCGFLVVVCVFFFFYQVRMSLVLTTATWWDGVSTDSVCGVLCLRFCRCFSYLKWLQTESICWFKVKYSMLFTYSHCHAVADQTTSPLDAFSGCSGALIHITCWFHVQFAQLSIVEV